MLLYLNTHVAIDQLRHKAQLNKTQGPKVCIYCTSIVNGLVAVQFVCLMIMEALSFVLSMVYINFCSFVMFY